MNVFHYDAWKDTDAVETLTYFLDAVITEFCNKLEGIRDSDDVKKREGFYFMEKAYRFALEHRAIGVGVLGWHSYLQEHMIAIESNKAYDLNKEIFEHIHTKAYAASKEMADTYGEPEVLK
jgi:ribonucleoside-diphosphate reductase alpha chain